MPEEVRTYNEDLGHEGSFGSKATDVRGPEPDRLRDDNLVDFQVMRQMARNLVHNNLLNTENKDKAMAMGAFRHALDVKLSKFDKASRITRLRYSQEVHQLDNLREQLLQRYKEALGMADSDVDD